jgi:hypothetical protein
VPQDREKVEKLLWAGSVGRMEGWRERWRDVEAKVGKRRFRRRVTHLFESRGQPARVPSTPSLPSPPAAHMSAAELLAARKEQLVNDLAKLERQASFCAERAAEGKRATKTSVRARLVVERDSGLHCWLRHA